jgi:hypothetical protein
MKTSLLPPAHSARLRHAAFLTLLAFGVQACGTWRAVPLYKVESGEQALEHVAIRVKEKGSTAKRTLQVSAVNFPFVEGTETGAPVPPAAEVQIDLREVQEIEVYDARTGLTILAAVGVVAALVGVVILIVALTKKSCPFVYVVTAEGPLLVGEAYSGAVTKATQRADLMPFPRLGGKKARVWLANEALETQYTDQLELWLVDHAPELRAVATAAAHPILVGAPLAPTRVTDLAGADVTSLVTAQDGRSWQTDLDRAVTAPEPDLREGLVATFPPPRPGTRQVLELQAGNTAWMDLVFGRWFALFGNSLDSFLASGEDPSSAAGALAWREREGVDLSIEVFRAGGWERASVVPPLGPIAMRRVAVPLPTTDPGEPVRVRLTGGLGFWRFDEIALSELQTAEPRTARVAPEEARQDDGTDVRMLLAASDGRYQVLARPGQKVDLAFQLPEPAPGLVRDAFLFTSGYYLVNPSPDAAKSIATLRTLRDEPRGLSRFSLDLYRQYRELLLAQETRR